MNYVLGKPYQDTSLMLYKRDVLDNMKDYLDDNQGVRGDYAKIAVGIDWGQHYHHIVVMGLKSNGVWDIIHLERVAKSTGTEHIEDDLRKVIQILNRYSPDIICPDVGLS